MNRLLVIAFVLKLLLCIGCRGAQQIVGEQPPEPSPVVGKAEPQMEGDEIRAGSTVGVGTETTADTQVNNPAPVVGLKAEFAGGNDGKGYIDLTWDPVDEGDVNIKGYRFYIDSNDPMKLVLQASIPIEKNTSIRLPVYKGGRNYRVKVVAITEGGRSGEGEDVLVYVPVLRLPSIESVSAVPTENGGILLTWEYPHIQSLEGFKIIYNYKPLEKQEPVPPEARSWVLTLAEAKDGDRCEVQIVPFSPFDEGLPSPPGQTRWKKQIELPSYDGLDRLSSRLYRYANSYYVELHWNKVDLEAERIQNYSFFANKYGSKKLWRLNVASVKGNQVKLKLPEIQEDEYILKVVPQYVDGSEGNGKIITLTK